MKSRSSSRSHAPRGSAHRCSPESGKGSQAELGNQLKAEQGSHLSRWVYTQARGNEKTDIAGGQNMTSIEPTENAKKVLESLKKAVSETLEKKRRLGHYAVIWDGKKPVLRGDDAPVAND